MRHPRCAYFTSAVTAAALACVVAACATTKETGVTLSPAASFAARTKLARDLVGRGDWGRSFAMLTDLHREKPEDAGVLTLRGIVYRELEAQGYRLPVIELGTKFFKPALYDDTVTVITRLKERPLLRIRLEYEVRRGDELLVTGFTVHTFIDKAGDPVRPPAQYTARMRELFKTKS